MKSFSEILSRKLGAYKPRLKGAKSLWTGRLASGLLCAGLSLGLTLPALANPTGPTIRHGQVNISPGLHTQIQQLTDKAIVDWQSFSIGANESVNILQPSQLAVMLSRVTGGDASQILGQLEANGQFFLVNPNGILFGPGSTVNVGSFVASTLNISDEDFLAGNYNFTQDLSQDLAAVVNQGTISIADGGYAVLTGPSVINEGTIIARAGNIHLAAGEQATLNLDGRDLIHFSLAGQVSDGTVLLAPGMMSDAIAQTLGVEQAQRADKLIRMDDGSVRMVSSSGTLVQAGTISADGRENLDAGTVRLDSTDLAIVADGSTTTASGQGLDSDGGEVVVFSHLDGDYSPMSRTIFESGSLLAAAGGTSGDAGFIEVSGEWVDLAGDVDLSRTDGAVGLFLLDPPDVVVVDDTFADDGRFGTATLVTDLFVETMLAGADFTVLNFPGGSVTLEVSSTSGGGDTGLQAPGSVNTLTFETPGGTFVDFNTDDINIGGDLFVNADGAVQLGSGTIEVGGDFNLTSGDNTDFQTATLNIVGEVSAQSNNDLDLGSSQTTASLVDLFANIEIRGDGAAIDTRGNPAVFTDGGDLIITSLGDVNLDNTTLQFAMPVGGTGLTVTADGGIQIRDGLVESEFDQPPMAPPQFLADVFIDALGGDLRILDTNLSGANVQFSALGSVEHSGGTAPEINASQDFNSASDTFFANNVFSDGNVDIVGASSVSAGTISAGTAIDLAGGSIDLDGSVLDAFTTISITGQSASLGGGASVRTPQREVNVGPGIIIPEINISVDDFINMEFNQGGGLRTLRLILETTGGSSTDSIIVAIDTTQDSVFDDPTRLTANSEGNITILDIAPDPTTNFAEGIDLVRPSGLPGTSSTEPAAVRSVTGNVTIRSAGNLGFGLGDGSTIADLGEPLVQAAGSVELRTLIRMNDQNSTLTSPDLLEVQTLGPVRLFASEVGNFNGTTEGRIEIDGESLTVRASVPDRPIHVASLDDLDFIDIQTNGGEVLVTENGIVSTTGGTIRYQPLVAAGPNVLQIDQVNPIQANLVRFANQADTLVDDVDVNAGQTLIISTTDDGSILSGNPGPGPANVTNNGTLVLNAEGSVGSLTDFLRVEANDLSVDAGVTPTSSLFLDLTPISPSLTVDIQGVDPDFLQTGLGTLPPTVGSNPGNIEVTDTVIIDVGGNLNVNSPVISDNGIAVTSTGTVNLNQALQTNANVLVEANQITNGDNDKLSGTGVGLNLGQNFGTNANFIDLAAQQLVLGSNPTIDYFLETGGEGFDLTWVDSLTVGNKTIAGNQANILEHTHTDRNILVNGGLTASDRIVLSANSTTPRDIAVNSTINATNRAEIRATGNITQGTSGPNTGLVDSAAILLDAGTDIGAITNDQQIDGGTLALSAGGNAYVQDQNGDLEVVNDGTLTNPLGAGLDLRVRADNGDLTLTGDIVATDAAFVAGTDLTINAQTTSPDIFINGDVDTTQNMAFLAVGDIVPGAGSVLTVGPTGALGLGAGGQIGAVNPVVINTPNLALNPSTGNIQAATTPTPVATVTSVGVTVNAQTAPPNNNPPTQTVTVNVTLQPVVPDPPADPVIIPEVLPEPQVLAQDNVDLVDSDIAQLLAVQDLIEDVLDPTAIPVGWWDDEDFMRKKFRR